MTIRVEPYDVSVDQDVIAVCESGVWTFYDCGECLFTVSAAVPETALASVLRVWKGGRKYGERVGRSTLQADIARLLGVELKFEGR